MSSTCGSRENRFPPTTFLFKLLAFFLEFFLGDFFRLYFWPSLDIKVEGANFATSDFCTLPLSYILCCLLSELSNRARGLHIALAGFFSSACYLISSSPGFLVVIPPFSECHAKAFLFFSRASPSLSRSFSQLALIRVSNRTSFFDFDFGVSAVSVFAFVLGYEGDPLNSILVIFGAAPMFWGLWENVFVHVWPLCMDDHTSYPPTAGMCRVYRLKIGVLNWLWDRDAKIDSDATRY